MRTELISIATDTLPLDGAFYLPDTAASGAVMLLHGNTMNFYVGAPRFLPPVLTRLGFACLAFNRPGTTFSASGTVGLPRAPPSS
jgi:pimeloyl-ACP methyl ester carboxylesterase